MKQKLIIANWKMHGTIDFVHDYGERLGQKIQKLISQDTDLDWTLSKIIVAPPSALMGHLYSLLRPVQKKTSHMCLSLAAQNIDRYKEEVGAYTGDQSASIISQSGCDYVIIGHSERRRYHKEDSSLLAAKARAVYRSGMTPIICIGEDLEAYEANKTKDVLNKQVNDILDVFWQEVNDTLPVMEPVIIAYEPIWAIGTGKTPTMDEIQDITNHLHDHMNKRYECVQRAPYVCYGGSVNADNFDDLCGIDGLDGFLIGGASLHVDDLFDFYQKSCKKHS